MDIIILPADKGNTIVVMSQTTEHVRLQKKNEDFLSGHIQDLIKTQQTQSRKKDSNRKKQN